MKNVLWVPLVLSLFGATAAQAVDSAPLKKSDRLAVFLKELSNTGKEAHKVRVRVALCIDREHCKEFIALPIDLNAGQVRKFTKDDDLGKRRSKVFTGEVINEQAAKYIEEQKQTVKEPKIQIAAMLARVGAKGEVLNKSESVFMDLPSLDEKGPTISKDVELKLKVLNAKIVVAIERE